MPGKSPVSGKTAENSRWAPPDTLRTADLDATDVSEFTLDTKMMDSMQSRLEKGADLSLYGALRFCLLNFVVNKYN